MGSEALLRSLAPVVALVAVMLHLAAPRSLLDAEARLWNRVRRAVLPALDRHKSEHVGGYAVYGLDDEEHVGHVDAPIAEVERRLADDGFLRMPLAALKTAPGGRIERGSWATRSGHPMLARDQLHIMLFEADDGGTDVYAHHERNAFNPLTAYQHYRGIGYDPERGVREAREILASMEIRG